MDVLTLSYWCKLISVSNECTPRERLCKHMQGSNMIVKCAISINFELVWCENFLPKPMDPKGAITLSKFLLSHWEWTIPATY
jgi:hypothetical protein